VGAVLAALPLAAASAQEAGKTGVPKPTVPTAQGFVASSSPVCSTDKTAPTLLGDPTPQLTAVVHVAPGGAGSELLRAHFDIQVRTAPGVWNTVASALAPPPDALVGDGQVVTTSVTDPLTEGASYRMAASTWSYASTVGDQYVASRSTATTSGWCYFAVDPTAPLAPTVAYGAPYTECTADDCASHGGPGVPGTFTLTPGAGDTGVVAYQYWLQGGPVVEAAGPTATVAVTPQQEGLAVLTVRAGDAAGRWGAQTQVSFSVARPAPEVGLWHFDDGQPGEVPVPASDTASGAGDRHPAALSGAGADWTRLGRRGEGDGALVLDGDSGHASTSGRVLDPAASFALSAWAFPADLTKDRTVLSQTGADGSGFALGFAAAAGTWQFSYAWNDATGTRHVAYAQTPAGADHVWTQLAGSYDAAAHTLTLYVNGTPQSSPVLLPATASAQGTAGELEFGRAAVADDAGSYGAYWSGSLDEVEVWQRPLSAADALQEARLIEPGTGAYAVANVASWNASGASGTTLADTTTGYGRTLTTQGGARIDDDAIVLDGVDGAATAPGPVVDGTGSFTVTARVQPDMAVIGAKPTGWAAQVVGQRAADGSSWGVWYRVVAREEVPDPDTDEMVTVPITQWLFGRVGADGSFSGVTSQDVTVWEPGTANDPVQVTGVVDAQSGTATLFVGHSRQGVAAFSPVAGAGDLTVGKAYLDGVWGSSLPGRVNFVGVWAGAMSFGQIVNLIGG
jgi:hypothetical protein